MHSDIHDVVFDINDSDRMYVGTDGGVYASINGGTTFSQFTSGLPMGIPVHDLAIQERENEIILGTHGRSLYIGKLDLVQKMAKDSKK